MKKILLILVLLIAAFWAYKYFKTDDAKAVHEKPKPVAVSVHSEAFNQSLADMLTVYYAMTDGFVNWDSSVVNTQANRLQGSLDNLLMDELKMDSVIYQTALFPFENARSGVGAILSATDWEGKRRGLQDLSENIRMLLITVKYDGATLYWQECPMAFGEGVRGNWLSAEETVVNPYLGNKDPQYGATMLHCGETKATIGPSTTDQPAQ